MDERIKKLGKDQQIALARVVSDLIMSDKIIDEKEVEEFAKLFGETDNRELFYLAQRISFAQALKLLNQPYDESAKGTNRLNSLMRNLHADIATEIVDETASSDGYCAPNEVLLLIAIDYFLKRNNLTYTKYDIQSFILTDVFIGKRFVLYADTSGSAQSIVIDENYELICNLLASIGFQFIYIPRLAKQFEDRGFKLFEAMSMYIFPDIPQDKVKEVYENITHMTTKTFVTKYLNAKLGFDVICPKPSLYVMIGRSSVLGNNMSRKGLAYDTYANFLKISIGDDNILDTISKFVVDYNHRVSYNMNIDFNPSKNKLLYHGFYKAFFRLVALAKENPDTYDINIDTAIGAIFINDKKVQLPAGKAAIYATIICCSLFGDKKGLPNEKIYNTLEKEGQNKIQEVYERVCALMKNNATLKAKASLYNSLRTRIPDIKAALKEAAPKNIIGQIQISNGDYLRTVIPPQVVTINKIPILDEEKWSQLFEKTV